MPNGVITQKKTIPIAIGLTIADIKSPKRIHHWFNFERLRGNISAGTRNNPAMSKAHQRMGCPESKGVIAMMPKKMAMMQPNTRSEEPSIFLERECFLSIAIFQDSFNVLFCDDQSQFAGFPQ